MNTRNEIIQQVTNKEFPFWKLYKGAGTTQRIAQCDDEENPTASPQVAIDAFVNEVNGRPAGTYSVTIYRRLKGESGGTRYEFAIPSQSTSNPTYSGSMTPEQIYAQAARDIEMKNALERIEKKQDLLIEAMKLLTDDNKDNDGIGKAIISLLGAGIAKSKAPAAAATAAPKIASNGFSTLVS